MRGFVYLMGVTAAVASLFMLTVRSEASGKACKEYETAIVIGPNRPVTAIGKACLSNGKWYLVNFRLSDL